MLEIIDLTDDMGFLMEEMSPEETTKEELEEVKGLLPFSFLAVKRGTPHSTYVFKVNYAAYPLYAVVDEVAKQATLTKRKPDLEVFDVYPDVSDDDVVFPYLKYRNIISKLFLFIASRQYLWIPIFGFSTHAMEVSGLRRETFEERVREFIALKRE
jgi:hypothetical protein